MTIEITKGSSIEVVSPYTGVQNLVLTQNQKSLRDNVRGNWIYNNGGVLVDGTNTPIRAIGFTAMELAALYADPYISDRLDVMTELQRYVDAGWKHLRMRVYVGMNGYDYLRAFGVYGDAGMQDKIDAYMDNWIPILDKCDELGIVLMLDFYGNPQAFSDYARKYSIEWADETSDLATAAKKFVYEFVNRFKYRKCIGAWEISGEWDMKWGYKAPITPDESRYTLDSYPEELAFPPVSDLAVYHEWMSAYLRSIDGTGRAVLSGLQGRIGTYFNRDIGEHHQHLENMTENMTAMGIHHYNGFCGTRDYSNHRSYLVGLRKLAKKLGVPFYIGECGVRTNFTTQGLTSQELHELEWQAIYDSGVQLAYRWIWRPEDYNGNESTKSSYRLHPIERNSTGGYIDAQAHYDFLVNIRDQIAAAPAWVDPDTLSEDTFGYTRTNYPSIGSDGTVRIEFDTSSVDRADGVCMSFWLKMDLNADRPLMSHKVFLSKNDAPTEYYGSGGFRVWTSGNNNLNFNVEHGNDYSDTYANTTSALSAQSIDENSEWVHVVITLDTNGLGSGYSLPNRDESSSEVSTSYDTHMMSIHLNGEYLESRKFEDNSAEWPVTWNPTNAPLVLFEEVNHPWPGEARYLARPGDGRIADLKIYSRTLLDREIRDIYLNDNTPAGTVVAHWDFANGSLVDKVGGITGIVTKGTPIVANDFNLPNKPYVINP